MTIPAPDAKDFFRLIKNLDAFFESRLHLLKDASLEEIRDLRTAGFADPAHVSEYVAKNPDGHSGDDLAAIAAWQTHGFADRFIVHQHRRGCVFSHSTSDNPHQLYLVQGLTEPIAELVPFFPCCVESRLLPFRGHIVTDGIIAPVMVHFGKSMTRSFADEVKQTIATRGSITTLPAGSAPSAPDPSALLQHYLSTAATRRDCARQIQQLCAQSPALRIQYLQHLGKANSRALKASLKAKGLTTGCFAVLEDTIIAGAADQATAEACATQLVPPEIRDGIVWVSI